MKWKFVSGRSSQFELNTLTIYWSINLSIYLVRYLPFNISIQYHQKCFPHHLSTQLFNAPQQHTLNNFNRPYSNIECTKSKPFKKFKTLQRKALKNPMLYEVKHIQKHTKFNTFNTQIRSKIQYIQHANSLKKYRKNITVLNKIKVFNSIK